MDTFFENNDINLKLNSIFKNRFNIDLFNDKEHIDGNDSLLGKKFGLLARDLVYLLYDVERKFNITIPQNDIDNIKFDTLNNIVKVINKELQQKDKEAV